MELLANVVKEWDYVKLFPKGDEDLAKTFGCDFELFDSFVMLRVFKIDGRKIGLARAEFFEPGSQSLDDTLFASRLCDVYWKTFRPLSSERYIAVEKIPKEINALRIKGIRELYVFTGNGSYEFPYEVWL